MPRVITTLQDFLAPQLENVQRQQQIGMQPLKEALMMTQMKKMMQPPQLPAFEQELGLLSQGLAKQGVAQDDIAKAQNLVRLQHLMGGQGQQTSVTLPSGETIMTGSGGAGMAMGGMPQSIQQLFGMQPSGNNQFGIVQGTQKAKGGFGGAVTYGPQGFASQPTTATTSQMQQQYNATGNALQALQNLKKSKPQYQNLLKSGMANVSGFLSRIVGGESEGASEMAESEADLVNAVESYLNAYNLPKTNESIAMVHRTLSPRPNESEKGYEKRLEREINKIQKRQQRLGEQFKGIQLNQKKEASENEQYSQEDLEFTANKYGISVEEVKRRLGAQ